MDATMLEQTSPPRRRVVRNAALKNLGFTGYMDVILEQLFYHTAFRRWVLALDLSASNTAALPADQQAALTMVRELQTMFRFLETARQVPLPEEVEQHAPLASRIALQASQQFLTTYDPTRFVQACEPCLRLFNSLYKPNDAAEFAHKFLEQLLQFSRVGYPLLTDTNNISATLESLLASSSLVEEKICTVCGASTRVLERKLYMCGLRTEGCANLEAALTAASQARAPLSAMIPCSKCRSQRKTFVLRRSFHNLADVLLLNCNLPTPLEKRERFEFPEQLNMKPYSSGKRDASTEQQAYNYQLVGVVLLKGVHQTARYHTVLKDRESGQWLRFYREHVMPYDAQKDLPDECFGGPVDPVEGAFCNARMLVYEKVGCGNSNK